MPDTRTVEAVGRSLDVERLRNARMVNAIRAGGMAGWVALALVFGVLGSRADLRAAFPLVAGYFAVAALVFVATRHRPRLLKHDHLSSCGRVPHHQLVACIPPEHGLHDYRGTTEYTPAQCCSRNSSPTDP